MVVSSNGNIFPVTGPLWEESTDHWWFSSQRPVTQSFDVFFNLRLNNLLGKQSRRWWFETPLRSLWRDSNEPKRDKQPGRKLNPTDKICSLVGDGTSGRNLSISWLLMPWFRASQSRQQPSFWLCRTNRSLSFMKRDFDQLHNFSGEKWYIDIAIFMFP